MTPHPFHWLKRLSPFLLLGVFALPALARDPFWPLGYVPEGHRPAPTPTPAPVAVATPVPDATPLTDEEIRQLAVEEAARIRENIRQRGVFRSGDQIFAHVQGDWRTIGDTFTVEARGQTYRLRITRLTPENIELEPHRVTATTPNPGN